MSNPCKNCGYRWQEEWESFPSCHYEGPHEWSPCEAEDEANRIERERREYEEFIKSEEERFLEE